MATYTWNGYFFDGSTEVVSQFMLDAGGYLWYYDQNYNAFFPAVLVNDQPVYQSNGYGTYANGQPGPMSPGSVLTSQDYLAQFVTAFAVSVITARSNTYTSDPTNVLNSSLQQPTTLVQTSINNALSSNVGLTTALASAAPFLTSTQSNFAFNDIYSSWQDGPALISSLQGLVANHQQNLTAATDAVSRLTDFKKKILKQIVQNADANYQLQSQLNTFQSKGTFTALASAFPGTMGPFQQSLSNNQATLGQQLQKTLPSSVASNNSIISSIFGGSPSSLNQIMNPIDKILLDVNNLDNQSVSIFDSFPVNGFGTLSNQTNFVNQVSSLLNSIVQSHPTVNTKSSVAITNPTTILSQLSTYVSTMLGGSTTTPTSQATNTLTASLSATSAAAQIGALTNTNPASGGSFSNILNTQGQAAIPLPTMDNLVIPQPNYTLSTDPEIANNQNSATQAATTASQSGTTMQVLQGNCINNISDVPLKPRCQPFDGGQGSFTGSQSVPF